MQNKFFPIRDKLLSESDIDLLGSLQIFSAVIKKKHVKLKLLKRNRIVMSSYEAYCKELNNLLKVDERIILSVNFNH